MPPPVSSADSWAGRLLKAITTENEGFKRVAEAKVADTAG